MATMPSMSKQRGGGLSFQRFENVILHRLQCSAHFYTDKANLFPHPLIEPNYCSP